MTVHHRQLNTSLLGRAATFMRPAQVLPEIVGLDSPAMDVMTDFSKVSAISVRAKTPMDRANAKMIRYGVRMLMVLDEHEHVVGLITAADLLGERPLRYLRTVGGGSHADIKVQDVMISQSELEVLELGEVRKSRVKDIVASLKSVNRQHLLVISDEGGQRSVCGLFSASQIARQLGVQLPDFELAKAFAEIDAVIA